MGQVPCFLCTTDSYVERNFIMSPRYLFEVDCEVCGNYLIDEHLIRSIKAGAIVEYLPKISAFTKARTIAGKNPITIFQSVVPDSYQNEGITIDEIIEWFPRDISKRIDLTLINLTKMSDFGSTFQITSWNYPIFYVDNVQNHLNIQFLILNHLMENGYIEKTPLAPLGFPSKAPIGFMTVTAKGWKKVEELRQQERDEVLSQLENQRLLFLQELYKITEGNLNSSLNMWELGEQLGLSRKIIQNVVTFLEEEGLLESVGIGGAICITHNGVKTIEAEISGNKQLESSVTPINHFYTYIGQNTGQIQQGTSHSTQIINNGLQQVDLTPVLEYLSILKTNLALLNLDEQIHDEADNDIRTVEIQLKSSEPKIGKIKNAVESLTILTKDFVTKYAVQELVIHTDKIAHWIASII